MNVSLSHTTDIQPTDCITAASPVVGLHCSSADGAQWNGLFSNLKNTDPHLLQTCRAQLHAAGGSIAGDPPLPRKPGK